MRSLFICAVLLFSFSFSAAFAQTPAQELGTCLSDNTTGKDRKELARWIFTAMATHPAIDSTASVKKSERQEASRRVGAIFTRLISESCKEEVRSAMNAGGSSVIRSGFGKLGRVAMQELMRNQEVSAAMEEMTRYIDMERIEKVLQEK